MSDNVLVIPATFMVGKQFPVNLPLSDGSMKPIGECTEEEVVQSVAEVRAMSESSRERLRRAYDEHVQDLEVLAQLSAYAQKYAEWDGVRKDRKVAEVMWSLDRKGSSQEAASNELAVEE